MHSKFYLHWIYQIIVNIQPVSNTLTVFKVQKWLRYIWWGHIILTIFPCRFFLDDSDPWFKILFFLVPRQAHVFGLIDLDIVPCSKKNIVDGYSTLCPSTAVDTFFFCNQLHVRSGFCSAEQTGSDSIRIACQWMEG